MSQTYVHITESISVSIKLFINNAIYCWSLNITLQILHNKEQYSLNLFLSCMCACWVFAINCSILTRNDSVLP